MKREEKGRKWEGWEKKGMEGEREGKVRGGEWSDWREEKGQ